MRHFSISLIILLILVTGCSGAPGLDSEPETIVTTVTEEEFNQQLTEIGFEADFQPDTIILTGEFEGILFTKTYMVSESDGEVFLGLRRDQFAPVEGGLDQQSINSANANLQPFLVSAFNTLVVQGYFATDSIVITDTEVTVTSSRGPDLSIKGRDP